MPGDELDEPLAIELPEDEAPEAEAVEVIEADAPDDEAEIIVAFDGDEPIVAKASEPDNSVIREFRKRNREQAAELARLKAQLETAPLVLTDEVAGPEPTLESCDWDEVKFREAARAYDRKVAEIAQRDIDRANAAARQAAADAAEGAAYLTARQALGARDYEDAEASFIEAFPNAAYQRLVVRAADDPAKLIYALYKAPAKLAALAAITDAAKLAAAVGKLEGRMTVTKSTSKVQPEKRVTGSGSVSGTASGAYEAQLAKLRAKADETGDLTPVLNYKREHAARIAAKTAAR